MITEKDITETGPQDLTKLTVDMLPSGYTLPNEYGMETIGEATARMIAEGRSPMRGLEQRIYYRGFTESENLNKKPEEV